MLPLVKEGMPRPSSRLQCQVVGFWVSTWIPRWWAVLASVFGTSKVPAYWCKAATSEWKSWQVPWVSLNLMVFSWTLACPPFRWTPMPGVQRSRRRAIGHALRPRYGNQRSPHTQFLLPGTAGRHIFPVWRGAQSLVDRSSSGGTQTSEHHAGAGEPGGKDARRAKKEAYTLLPKSFRPCGFSSTMNWKILRKV